MLLLLSPIRGRPSLRSVGINVSRFCSLRTTNNGYSSCSTPTRQTKKPWSTQDLESLKTLWKQGLPAGKIGPLLARTPEAVHMKASDLQRSGLMKRKFALPFTLEEDAIVLAAAGSGLKDKLLAMRLPGRAIKQIQNRRYQLKTRAQAHRSGPFTADEIKTMIHLREKEQLNWTGIAHRLARRPQALRNFYVNRVSATSGTVIPNRRMNRPEDFVTARSLRARGMTVKEVAHVMERSSKSVEYMCTKDKHTNLDTSTPPLYAPRWSDEQVGELLALHAQGLSRRDIGKKLHRSAAAVTGKLRLLKFSRIHSIDRRQEIQSS